MKEDRRLAFCLERDSQTDRQTDSSVEVLTWLHAAGDVSEHVGRIATFVVRRDVQLYRPVVNEYTTLCRRGSRIWEGGFIREYGE